MANRGHRAGLPDYRGAAVKREGRRQRCVDCRRLGGEWRRFEGRWERVKIQRDHPVELIDRGPKGHTVARCSRCHNEKTQAARAARARAKGQPVGKGKSKRKTAGPVGRVLAAVAGAGLVGAAFWLIGHPVDATRVDPADMRDLDLRGFDVAGATSDAARVGVRVAVVGAVVVLAGWVLWRWHRRRVEWVQDTADALGVASSTDTLKVKLRVRRWRHGFPTKGRGHYASFFDPDEDGKGRAGVQAVVNRLIGDVPLVWDTRKRTYRWDATAPAPEPTVVSGVVADPHAGIRARVEARLAATVKGSRVEWGQADDQGPVSFDFHYPATFNDEDHDDRAKVVSQVNVKLGTRWRATWDTQGNVARFERRPPLAAMIPNPGTTGDDPWVIPFGVNEDRGTVAWDRRVSPHALIAGPTGAGKTVTLRSIVTNGAIGGDTVFCCDPKRTELTGLRGWPGVRVVASSIEHIIALITMLADEMDARYDAIEAGEVREVDLQPVLIVVDELTEVVMRANRHWKATGGKSAEHPVVERLMSMVRLGRTGRMHVVIGIQRPDAKIMSGEGRDNVRFRASLGPLSQDGARMMFGRTDVGRDLPDDAKGRATVQIANDSMEVQTYYTPNPRELRADWERGHLDRLAAAARGRASQAVPHINAESVAAYAAAMDDPDAPLPKRPVPPRRKPQPAPEQPVPDVWDVADADDLAAGLAEGRVQWIQDDDTELRVVGVVESPDEDGTFEVEVQPADPDGVAFVVYADKDTAWKRRFE